jgi:hypothetical protein
MSTINPNPLQTHTRARMHTHACTHTHARTHTRTHAAGMHGGYTHPAGTHTGYPTRNHGGYALCASIGGPGPSPLDILRQVTVFLLVTSDTGFQLVCC